MNCYCIVNTSWAIRIDHFKVKISSKTNVTVKLLTLLFILTFNNEGLDRRMVSGRWYPHKRSPLFNHSIRVTIITILYVRKRNIIHCPLWYFLSPAKRLWTWSHKFITRHKSTLDWYIRVCVYLHMWWFRIYYILNISQKDTAWHG